MDQPRSPASEAAVIAPRPWDWQWISAPASGGGHLYLIDASGRKIAALWGKAAEKEEHARLIVKLINEAKP